jgi:hypothetical protein
MLLMMIHQEVFLILNRKKEYSHSSCRYTFFFVFLSKKGIVPVSKQEHSNFIKSTALALGFSFCGISKAAFLEEEAPRLEAWLKKNYQGKMSYLENHFDKRLDPTLLVPGAKSVVSLIYNYYPEKDLAKENPDNFKIAKYAYGEDYHQVIKDKLKLFLEKIREEVGQIEWPRLRGLGSGTRTSLGTKIRVRLDW